MHDRLHEGWELVSLEARIQNAKERQRYEAGSPDRAEVEAYRRQLFANTSYYTAERPSVVVLGMTPELRRMALPVADRVVSIDQNEDAVALYRDWVPETQRGRETIVLGDWVSSLEGLDRPVDGVLGDGVFGNLLTLGDQERLLRAIESRLAPGGVLVVRQALIPDGFAGSELPADALLRSYRSGALSQAEFAFGMRLWGAFDSAYDARTQLLDNARVFGLYDAWHREGRLTDEEHALIRRYYYGGRNSLLRQRAWEQLLARSGFSFECVKLSGKAWYDYYPLYVCRPIARPRTPQPVNAVAMSHRRLRREVHVALIEKQERVGFAGLMAFWINSRCQRVSASVNERLQEADVLWVCSQDPLKPEQRSAIAQALASRRPGARIMNALEHYDAYHESGCFERLAAAGVQVPQLSFGPEDIGRTPVVYKRAGEQMSNKEQTLYAGARAAYRVFGFVDSRGPDGQYRRYRAYYIAGAVRPSKLMRCSHWNVCLKNGPTLELGFELSAKECEQLRLIASTLKLDYFAVDFVRRAGDEEPFFVDINIYPRLNSTHRTSPEFGARGTFHTFDTRTRFGVEEPGGQPFARVFDDALVRFARGEPYPAARGALHALTGAQPG